MKDLIKIDSAGHVLTGHGRVEAAKQLSLDLPLIMEGRSPAEQAARLEARERRAQYFRDKWVRDGAIPGKRKRPWRSQD
jgi:hypothetical protein